MAPRRLLARLPGPALGRAAPDAGRRIEQKTGSVNRAGKKPHNRTGTEGLVTKNAWPGSLSRPLCSPALQQPSNLSHQLLRFLRLGQKQVGEGRCLRRFGIAREHHHRQAGPHPFHLRAQLDLAIGQVIVHDHQVHRLLLKQLQPAAGAAGPQHGIAVLLQDAGQGKQHDCVVVHDENAWLGWHEEPLFVRVP